MADAHSVLYAATVAIFSHNLHKAAITTQTQSNDVETPEIISAAPVRTDTAMSQIQPGSPTPPAITAPLRVDTLPKDFEPRSQIQSHCPNPEDASQAGIEPPTPILKVQAAQKGKEKETNKRDERLRAESATVLPALSPISPSMHQ